MSVSPARLAALQAWRDAITDEEQDALEAADEAAMEAAMHASREATFVQLYPKERLDQARAEGRQAGLREAAEAMNAFNVHDMVTEYEFRGDADYKPTVGEQALLEDAVTQALSDVADAILARLP